MKDDPATPRGRLMGLDVGQVRIGVALCDELGMAATPYATILRQGLDKDMIRLRELASQERVAGVIVGFPLGMDGTVGAQAEEMLRFIARLQRELGRIPVVRWDERLTTAEAERVLLDADVSRRQRREVVDRLAATLILNSYLEAHPREP